MHEIVLRSRIVLPVSKPPVEDGAVVIRGQTIQAVAPWTEVRSETTGSIVDLGESILLPGFVNAHCHLDYTHMAGMIPPPKEFADWIKSIIAIKSGWSYTEFAQSWVDGAAMLLESGVTTVADVEAVPELLPEAWDTTPLRVYSFLELLNVRQMVSARKHVESARKKGEALSHPRNRVALSPHALYSTTPELVQIARALADEKHWLMATHIAESRAEMEMFAHGSGALFDWLRKQRDTESCGTGSPLSILDRLGYLNQRLLAIHCNYVDEADIALLAQRQVSVVHCPRSHRYFEHETFPWRRLLQSQVNIALGTDSLATTRTHTKTKPALDMFEEIRTFASIKDAPSEPDIVTMATLNGAKALRLGGQVGELSPGGFADLVAIPFPGNLTDTWSAVIHHAGPVSASMIEGRWAIEPQQ